MMKHKLSATLGLIISMISPLVTSTVNAQTVTAGPYYADASWDQTLACTTLANCPRFSVLSNMSSAAVLDRQTGLVWERSPDTGPFQWGSDQAIAHCNNLSLGNRKGWRLPTIQELGSLVDPDPANAGAPRLPPGHPFQNVGPTTTYWSANPLTPETSAGFFVWTLFAFDGSLNGEISIANHAVWCVRGGKGLDVQ
jgi:hypothetical protein